MSLFLIMAATQMLLYHYTPLETSQSRKRFFFNHAIHVDRITGTLVSIINSNNNGKWHYKKKKTIITYHIKSHQQHLMTESEIWTGQHFTLSHPCLLQLLLRTQR